MITKIVTGQLEECCYILEKNKDCIIIDAGNDYKKVKDYIDKNNLNVLAILLTHGHFDHAGSCAKFQKDGIKIYIHKLDADKLYTDGNLSNLMNETFEKFHADYLIEEGDLTIGDFKFYVLHTPGHSEGSVSYIYENNVFCGDTLFENGVGKYDFYDGSFLKLRQSIKKLYNYKKQGYNFFYGH